MKTEQVDTQALPAGRARYTKGEELFNILTHALGALFGVAVLIAGVVRTLDTDTPFGIIASVVYGGCMVLTYSVSAIYHGLKQSRAKDILRVIDHCTIYLLIMGTYTGITLTGILPANPVAAAVILTIQWTVGSLAIILTAIDMKRFVVFSMICYIVLGWSLMGIVHIAVGAIGLTGFLWLLFGGIAYTVGSVLYGIGRKKRYVHSVFHIFCVIGSVLQFVGFIVYCF